MLTSWFLSKEDDEQGIEINKADTGSYLSDAWRLDGIVRTNLYMILISSPFSKEQVNNYES